MNERHVGARSVWHVVRWLLTGASLAWLAWLLKDAWNEVSPEVGRINLPLVGVGILIGSVSTSIGFVAFYQIFLALDGRRVSRLLLAHYYFSAQLMKHLPGRFFGIGYQIAATKGWISASTWLAANGIHLLLMMSLSVVASLAVLVTRGSWLTASVLFFFCGMALVLAWRLMNFVAPIRWLERSRWKLCVRLADVLRHMLNMGRSSAARSIVMTATISWIVYFAAWSVYGAAYPDYDASTWIRICAYYNIAWLVGYLSFVTPSGLGVRELVFAYLAADLEPGALAYSMVVGRFTLLLIDLLLGASLLGFGSKNERH